MPTETAVAFHKNIEAIEHELAEVSAGLADVPWRRGGWTRKEIVGHLMDSAANNRQRFVRAAIDGGYSGPSYLQDEWVAAHGYAGQPWQTLLEWWIVEHEILKAVVDRIPEERLGAQCQVGDAAPVTLRFLIEDYVAHQRHHLRQIKAAVQM